MTNNSITENLQDLKISFDSIKINNDHDLLFDGEWRIDAYVNGKKISLLSNSSIASRKWSENCISERREIYKYTNHDQRKFENYNLRDRIR